MSLGRERASRFGSWLSVGDSGPGCLCLTAEREGCSDARPAGGPRGAGRSSYHQAILRRAHQQPLPSRPPIRRAVCLLFASSFLLGASCCTKQRKRRKALGRWFWGRRRLQSVGAGPRWRCGGKACRPMEEASSAGCASQLLTHGPWGSTWRVLWVHHLCQMGITVVLPCK